MSPAWAAVLVSVVVALGALGRELIHRGQRDGKIDAILAELTRIAADHETRIRLLEIPPHTGSWQAGAPARGTGAGAPG